MLRIDAMDLNLLLQILRLPTYIASETYGVTPV